MIFENHSEKREPLFYVQVRGQRWDDLGHAMEGQTTWMDLRAGASTIILFNNPVALISETVSKLLMRELLELWSSFANVLWTHEP
jgi:hypothetical protein